MRRPVWVLLLAAVLVAAAPAPAPAAPPTLTRGIGLFVDTNEHLKACSGPEVGKHRYIVVHAHVVSSDPSCTLAMIKQANPGASVLAYINVGAFIAGPHPAGRPTTCVSWETANANEGWFLHDSAGNRLTFNDYSYLWAADVGEPGYRRACSDRFAQVKADGFHGVMLDDANTFASHGLLGRMVEYTTDNAYGDAAVELVRHVGPAALGRCLLVFPNVAQDPWTSAHRTRAQAMAVASSGLLREHFTSWSDGVPFTGATWRDTVSQIAEIESVGRIYLPHSYADTDDRKQYAIASFLLHWDGATNYGVGVEGWTANAFGRDPGAPTGARFAVGSGWRRNFTAGTVVVNPAASGNVTFSLGQTYVKPDGTQVTQITLAPGKGYVLTTP